MSDAEIFLEISYERNKFNPIQTLYSLSSFTELVGGINGDIVAREIPHWYNHENISFNRENITTIQERLLGGELEFRVLFFFRENQELTHVLAQAYKKPDKEVKTYFRGGNVLLGYGTICISIDETVAIMRIYPDIDILANIMMEKSVVSSYWEQFCQVTNALSAHWENFDDEILIAIWSNKGEHPKCVNLSFL
jgi:hypothetical protein